MRNINPDKVAVWFDPRKLKAYFLLDGYDGYTAPMSRILHVSEKTAKDKMSQSRLTQEETLLIAQALNLTLEQYGDIFAKNVYGKEEAPRE